MSATAIALKQLQSVKDKLQIQREESEITKQAIADEETELEAYLGQLTEVQARISATLSELHSLEIFEQKSAETNTNDEETMRTAFNAIFDQAIKDLRSNFQQQQDPQRMAWPTENVVREVSLIFDDEEAVFRVNATYNFEALLEDACRYFEVHPHDYELLNDHDINWPGEALVRSELSQYENQYGRVFLKAVPNEEEEAVDDEDLDDFLQLMRDKPLTKPPEAAPEQQEVVANVGGGTPPPPKKQPIDRRALKRELPSIVAFVSLFIIALMTRRTILDNYGQVTAVRTALIDEAFGDFNEKTYYDIANFEEVFDWLDGVFVAGIFPDETYSGSEPEPKDIGTVMGYNRLVGSIRFRQIRSMPDVGCPRVWLNERLRQKADGTIYTEEFVPECHAPLSPRNEDRNTYGPAVAEVEQYGDCDSIPQPGPELEKKELEAALEARQLRVKLCKMFVYSPDMGTPPTTEGVVAGTLTAYRPGGFVRDVDNPIDCREVEGEVPVGLCKRGPKSAQDLADAIGQMRDNLWFDSHTRVLLIKAAFYNGNFHSYVATTFILEFTRGGEIKPSVVFGPFNTASLNFETNPTAALFEISVYCFVLFNTLNQIRIFVNTCRKTGSVLAYFKDIWNIIEFTVLVFFYISVSTRAAMLASLYPDPMIFEEKFIDYYGIASQYALSFNFDSVCVLALFTKLFKYTQLNPDLNLLWSIVTKSSVDIGFFLGMLMVLIFGFAMVAVQILGTTMPEYAGVGHASVALVLVLLGQFDLAEMVQASNLFGFSFFFLYIVIMFFILMNIFLAILGEAYSECRVLAQEEKAAMVKTKSVGFRKWATLRWRMYRKWLKRRKEKGTAGTRAVRIAA